MELTVEVNMCDRFHGGCSLALKYAIVFTPDRNRDFLDDSQDLSEFFVRDARQLRRVVCWLIPSMNSTVLIKG